VEVNKKDSIKLKKLKKKLIKNTNKEKKKWNLA